LNTVYSVPLIFHNRYDPLNDYVTACNCSVLTLVYITQKPVTFNISYVVR